MKNLSNRVILTSISLLFFLPVGGVVAASGITTVQPHLSPEAFVPELPSTSKTQKGYIWPASGMVTLGFGQRKAGKIHTGIDIAGALGTPVWASASGIVVFAGLSQEGSGNLVTLQHSDGSLSVYAHNDRLLVRVGERVKQGQQIATMGNTGNSTSPHLHFEIRPQGQQAANPRAFLPTQHPPKRSSSVRANFSH